MTLEGPIVLALITMFGIGMVCGALLLGAVIVATVVVIRLRSDGKGAVLPVLSGLDATTLSTLDKGVKSLGLELEAFARQVSVTRGRGKALENA